MVGIVIEVGTVVTYCNLATFCGINSALIYSENY
jgi:hypothetical protein